MSPQAKEKNCVCDSSHFQIRKLKHKTCKVTCQGYPVSKSWGWKSNPARLAPGAVLSTPALN